jgi:Flp pilus assembly protein TadG
MPPMIKHHRLTVLISRLANRDGAAAVEFAILAPVLALLLAGAVDFGGVVFQRFNLDNAVSSASNFAINSKSNINGTNGATVATTLATILTGAGTNGGTIVVNNGPTVTITNGTASSAANSTNANSCYCPTRSGDTIAWGAAAACGSACGGGGKAGKFVTIAASRTYTPLFSNYGFIDENQEIWTLAVIQTE